MSISKEKMLLIGGSLLGVSTGIAATIGGQLMESGFASSLIIFTGNVAGNLISNVAQNICNAFSKKVVVRHPDKLNHDLKKTLLISIDRALHNAIVLYKDTKPTSQDLSTAIDFTKSAEKQLKEIFNQQTALEVYDKHIQLYMHTPIEEATNKIQNDLQNELNNEDLSPAFRSLFKESFAKQFRLCFTEELKDTDNSASWVAFQKMMLEATKKDIEELLEGQQRIETKIDELKKQQTLHKLARLSPKQAEAAKNLVKELNQPARIQLQLDQALDNMLEDIKKELGEIKQLVNYARGDITALRSDIEAERIHWWSRKMVIAYVLILVLAVTIVIVRNYFLAQPFMISVIVHGPKGIDDIVVKNRGTVVMNYGDKTERQRLNEKGEALFRQIPGKYRDDSSEIIVTDLGGDPYKPTCNSCSYKLEPGETYYIQLEPYGLDQLYGIVVDEQRKPLQGVSVMIQDMEVTTDSNGLFKFEIPPAKQKRLQDITAIKKGYKEESLQEVPPNTQTRPVPIQLQKK